MRTLILTLATAAALLAPAAAFADATPTTSSAANQFCKQQQKTLGTTGFATAYKTYGKCVSANTKNALNAIDNASKACAAERTANPSAFTAKNAFGKCVSGKVSQAAKTAGAKAPSALKQCKALRKSDASGFASKYPGANGLGKCVAATAKA